jgi:hypothetical protein
MQNQKPISSSRATFYGVVLALTAFIGNMAFFIMSVWSSRWAKQSLSSPRLLQALHTVTLFLICMPLINICHSFWNLYGELARFIGIFEDYNARQFNPSPWGSLDALVEHGIAGESDTVSLLVFHDFTSIQRWF